MPASSVITWPGMRSEYSWIPPHDHATVSRPGQVGVSFTDHRDVVQVREGRGQRVDVTAGMVFATGQQSVTWVDVREPTEVVEIYLEHDVLGHEIQPVSRGWDPAVLGVAAVLKRVHVGNGQLESLAASTLAHLLGTHLATHYCAARPRPPEPGRLDRAQLARVAGRVEERMHEPLRLDDLSAWIGLSPYHFARAFKASTGLAPHQFVTMRRMERAKTEFLRSAASVAAVAHCVGYTNLSHFRRTFRRHTGFLPSDLR